MAYPDLLLHLDSYPSPMPEALIGEAVALAASLGAKVTGLAVEVDIPVHSNRLADYLIGLSALGREEEARCRAACKSSLAHFTAVATAAGAFQDAILARTHYLDRGEAVTRQARARDLCVLPRLAGVHQFDVAQAVVFGCGRPVLIFQPGGLGELKAWPELAVVAWDGSRGAARALADALPLLKRAGRVQVLTVLNEKPGARPDLGLDAVRHLAMHGVSAVREEIDADGKPISETLEAHLGREGANLLVMGAYGHSRVQEFLLGGATDYALRSAACPVLLSH